MQELHSHETKVTRGTELSGAPPTPRPLTTARRVDERHALTTPRPRDL